MARQYRFDHEGALHHVMTRGVEKRPIFLDDSDRADFVRRLGRCSRETGTSILAWTLMPNHIHLLSSTGRIPLSRFMQKLLTGHAVRFNSIHERVGPLFQGRYRAILVQAETYLIRLVRYIHLNPVRAGIVRDVEELGRYPWTGHAVLLDPALRELQPVRDVLRCFSEDGHGASAYLDYLSEPETLVDAAFDEGTFFIGPGGLRARTEAPPGSIGRDRHLALLGDRAFSEELLRQLDARSGDPAVRSRRYEHETAMRILDLVESSLALPRGALRRGGGGRTRSLARELTCYCLVAIHGLPLRDAAGILGITRQAAYYALGRYRKNQESNNHRYNDILAKASAGVNANA